MTVSRRSFLATGAALSIGSVMQAAHAVPTPSPAKWDMEVDVVIVGAGGGGLGSAIIASLQTPLKIVVLEKEPLVGGSSTMCGGFYSTYDTERQRNEGIKDSKDLFLKDMLDVGKHKNDPALVEAFIDSGKIFYEDIIRKQLGLQEHEVTTVSGMSVPRGHCFDPAKLIQAMYKFCKDRNVQFLLNTPASRLTWSHEDQCINGVLAKRKGKDFYIHARKGVLLTSGGFARNPVLLEKYVPAMGNIKPEGGLGNTGDGILMAQAYGADVMDTPYIKGTHGYRVGNYGPQTTHSYSGGAILLNLDGKRFCDESISYKVLSDLALAQKDGKTFAVFDEPIRQQRMKARQTEKEILSQMDGGKEVPFCHQGAILEEAAKKAGLDPKVVQATVDKYNKDIAEQGFDTVFGRRGLAYKSGKLVPIATAPFFIMPIEPRLIATYCGLKINPKAQVIDVFGNPIKGLFAAGEVTGGTHGAAYMSGTALSKGMAMGRIAILEMAK